MRTSRWRRQAALVAAGAALATGCQGEDPPTLGPALERALSAFAAHDARALCDSLSKAGRTMVGTAAHRQPPFDCARDVRPFLRSMQPYRGGPRPRVVAVEENGDGRATAEVRLAGGTAVELPFTRERGRWRLDALFGARRSALQALEQPRAHARLQLDGDTTPADAGAAARDATRPGRPPCPATTVDEIQRVEGGCQIRLVARGARISVWGPFGVFPYGTCDVYYTLTVDGDGRAWISDFLADGFNPCPDTIACYDRETQNIPWPATLERIDGRVAVRIENACLDTCMGRFEGDWELGLRQTRDGLRVGFGRMLGATGLTIEGVATAPGERIEIGD